MDGKSRSSVSAASQYNYSSCSKSTSLHEVEMPSNTTSPHLNSPLLSSAGSRRTKMSQVTIGESVPPSPARSVRSSGNVGQERTPGDDKKCTICRYNNIEKKATDVCTECEEMFLCQECRHAHRQNSVSRYHTIIPISIKVAESVACDRHDGRPMKYYCLQCDETACAVCMEQLHSGHDVRNFFVFAQETGNEMAEAKKKSEMRANDLYAIDGEMKDLWQTISARMEQMVADVQDHTNSILKQIMKQRDDMVFRIQRTCDVRGMEQTMEEWIQVRKRIANGIQIAETLSSKMIDGTPDLNELVKAKNELRIMGNYKHVSSAPYRERLRILPHFTTMNTDVQIGKLVEPGTRSYQQASPPVVDHASGQDVQYKDLSGNYDLPFPLQGIYRNIHCVAHLKPEGFAALCSQSEVGAAAALMLWTKECFHLISYGIHPAWDMVVDTQGIVTVLCSARPYLRMYDPETRSRCGSIDIQGELSYPQSLAVNSSRGHYVILDGMGNHRLVVFDRDGNNLQYLKVGWDHWRIACDERFLVTCSSQEVSIYEWNNNRLSKTRSFLHGGLGFNIRDIACHGGDAYVVGVTSQTSHRAGIYRIPGKNFFQTFVMEALSFGDAELTMGDNWWLRCDINDDMLVMGCRVPGSNFGRIGIFALKQQSRRQSEPAGQVILADGSNSVKGSVNGSEHPDT